MDEVADLVAIVAGVALILGVAPRHAVDRFERAVPPALQQPRQARRQVEVLDQHQLRATSLSQRRARRLQRDHRCGGQEEALAAHGRGLRLGHRVQTAKQVCISHSNVGSRRRRSTGCPYNRSKQAAVMLLDCAMLDWEVERIVADLGRRYDYNALMSVDPLLEPAASSRTRNCSRASPNASAPSRSFVANRPAHGIRGSAHGIA